MVLAGAPTGFCTRGVFLRTGDGIIAVRNTTVWPGRPRALAVPTERGCCFMKVVTMILGILLVMAGIGLLFVPGLTFLSVGWMVGLALLIAGIGAIANYALLHRTGLVSGLDLFVGILTGGLGILLLLNQTMRVVTDVVAVYLLGAWLLIGGVVRIIEAVMQSRVQGSGWGWWLVLGILMIGLGVYSLMHPLVAAVAIGWLMGFYIVMAGIDLLVLGASVRKVTEPDGAEHWMLNG